MEKTLFSEVYLIGKIKITICVGGTVIADKNCYSGELKLYKPLMITYFAVVFHISYPPNFCFSFFIFPFTWNSFLLPVRRCAEFILIF